MQADKRQNDISQLRQLACFPRLRSLQLNDNPVAEQSDYVERILEAVPWILELDNEGISESSKDRAIQLLFRKVMNEVGMQYLEEKIANGDVIATEPPHPNTTQEVIITLCVDERLSQFYTYMDYKFTATADPHQEDGCFRKERVPLNKLMSGMVEPAVLWSALIEASHIGKTSLVLRRLLFSHDDFGDIDKNGLALSCNFQARWNVFSHEKMCLRQKDRLFSPNKEERDSRELTAPDNNFRPEHEQLASGSRDHIAKSQLTEETCNMEPCFFEHLNFDPKRFSEVLDFDAGYLKQHKIIHTSFIKVQALVRDSVCKHCFTILKQLLAEKDQERQEQERMRECLVSKIQAMWRGKRFRKNPAFNPQSHNTSIQNSSVEHILRIQSLWRGFWVRRNVKRAKEFSKYIDDDEFEYSIINEKEFLIDESAFYKKFQSIHVVFDSKDHVNTSSILAEEPACGVNQNVACLPIKDEFSHVQESNINSPLPVPINTLGDSENVPYKFQFDDIKVRNSQEPKEKRKAFIEEITKD